MKFRYNRFLPKIWVIFFIYSSQFVIPTNLRANLTTSKSFCTLKAKFSKRLVPATSPKALWWSLKVKIHLLTNRKQTAIQISNLWPNLVVLQIVNCFCNCSSKRLITSCRSLPSWLSSASLTTVNEFSSDWRWDGDIGSYVGRIQNKIFNLI